MKHETAERIIVKARAGLLLDQPFWGCLALRLKPRPDSRVKGLATDGETLFYNPEYVETTLLSKIKGSLAHEVGHCSLMHHARIGNRDLALFNKAADYALNPILMDAGFDLDGALCDARFRGKSAEEAYAILDLERESSQKPEPKAQNQPDGGTQQQASGGQSAPAQCQGDNGSGNKQQTDSQKSKRGKGNGGSSAQPDQSGDKADSGARAGAYEDFGGVDPSTIDPAGTGAILPSPKPVPEAEREMQQAVQQALTQAKAMGCMPGGLERVIRRVIDPLVDWKGVLQDFVDAMVRNDYSWKRPDRRFVQQGVYLPEVGEPELSDIVVGVDTSGSINDELLAAFATEITAIMQAHKTRVHVVYCDSRVQGTEVFEPDDEAVTLEAKGGGGTDFRPVFDWVESEDLQPSCMVYFTDMEGRFPKQEPSYPVLWACHEYRGHDYEAPFGRFMYLED